MKRIALTMLAVVLALVSMEWLFFATQYSFMSGQGWVEKLSTLCLALIPSLVFAGAPIVALFFLARWARLRRAAEVAGLGWASLLAAGLYLLLLDNFTNTVLGFGILRAEGLGLWLYAALLILFLLAAYRTCRFLAGWFGARSSRLQSSFTGFVGLALVAGLLAGGGDLKARQAPPALGQPQRTPNIVLVGGDGINARRMSAYGYVRDTSPFLASLVPRSVLFENAYANCAHTTGSLASMLTGRHPIYTRVVYPPDILRGDDMQRHLPGILKRHGYRTFHVSIRHYADAYDMNLRDGFDHSTFQRQNSVQRFIPFEFLLTADARYFSELVLDRLQRRAARILRMDRSQSAFEEAELAKKNERNQDERRMLAFREFLRTGDEPFFAHLHLMTTHGSRFHPRKRVFSSGQEQNTFWMEDFYDDAILDFDTYLAEIVSILEEFGKRDDTLLIVYSDHGKEYDARLRVPLVFSFPGGQFAGRRVQQNVQNLDIAPTIVDYLGLEVPEWMQGISLLTDPPWQRDILSVRTYATVGFGKVRVLDKAKLRPPFYSMEKINLINHQRAYALFLNTMNMRIVDMHDHTRPVRATALPKPMEAKAIVMRHLRNAGYELGDLPMRVVNVVPPEE